MAGIVWWEIETPNPEAFRKFHGGLWGWEFEPAFADTGIGADYWIIRADGQGIGGLQRSATAAAPHPGPRLYVEVGDLEETLRQVQAADGAVERPRTALGGSDAWFATIVDPAGISFGLWTPNPPAA